MIHFDEMACLLYLEGQLEPARAREMALHVGECAECRTLLHALERESHVLSAALTEDNEAMPARLLSTRSWGVPSWVWTLAFGVFAFGAYWLWADSVDPWLQRLSNAGFGGTDFVSMLLFSGAFWEGWSYMIDVLQVVAVVLVLHLTLLRVAGEADVVVWRQEQAGAFPVEPVPDRVDFALLGFLLGHEVVQAEHH